MSDGRDDRMDDTMERTRTGLDPDWIDREPINPVLQRRLRLRRGLDPRDGRHGPVPDGMVSFRIATWNIHSCVGIDARFSPDRIAATIRHLDVDILGLQEVGWHHRGEVGLDQFEFLSQATGLNAYPMPTKHHARAHYGNALFTRFPVKAFRPIPLTVGHREPRGGIDAELEIEGRLVRVMVAHFGLDPWERNHQITRIIETLGRGAQDMPTVFMGDLNEWRPSSPRLKRLTPYFPDVAGPRSFHARLPTLRLDRIFVSKEIAMPTFEVVRNDHTRRASDHLPVRATLAIA
ncbi:MAG TPA: endonuclease/exonuclease/phosphatase family protein [Azospirillaceae bacterium]|nr:endonuclease/exonuclease/phosphatase family protein [Azospirillaceae bacterium]